MNEGAPTLAPNGQILIFTACAIRGDYGPGRRGFGSCDLFASRKQGEGWSPPQNLGNTVNSNKWETQPSFSSDGRTLYFIQGKGRGRKKKQDIYKTMLQKDGSWLEPQKLSSTINTPGKEASVFIHPDDETLYFSSNGHPGMGGLDIYMSRKKDNGEWGEPVNLGYPINTKNDENSLLVSPDGKKAYFGTNREGGHGKLDLYSFQLPKKVRPQKVSYLKGTVTDAETGEPVGANFELIDRKTGEEIVNSWANPGNGEYVVALPPDRNYVLNASKRGYVFLSDSFELRSSGDDVEPVHKDVQMERIEPGKTVELKNVFFDTDKYELKPESRAELMKLYKFLKNNANLKIELAGHTDSVGTKEDNQVLSENRAQAVRDFLMEQGIDENRLTAKGYGETRPVATNETPEGRQKNRRTEFKILEVEGKE